MTTDCTQTAYVCSIAHETDFHFGGLLKCTQKEINPYTEVILRHESQLFAMSRVAMSIVFVD